MNANNINDDLLLSLINKLFESLKKKNLVSLQELAQEKLYKALLLEIEPKLELICGKIEINDDNSFGVRYANFVEIINALEKYLAQSSEKEKFTQQAKLKNYLIINNILKSDKDQVAYLAEFLFFLSSISSKKDYYLDRIGELDDIHPFFQYIEKFIVLDKFDETNILDKSYLINVQFSRLKDDYEKERTNMVKIIKDYESQISNLKFKNENLEKNLSDVELKLKDKEREYEMVKMTQSQNFKFQEQLFKDTLANTDLISQINQKDLEIHDMKRENDMVTRRYQEEIQKLKEKIESQDDKIQEYKTIKAQYDKLNAKFKEINITKDKKNDYDDVKLALEQKNKHIELLLKEKQGLTHQIEKINKDLLTEKENARQIEFEKKKLEYDLNDIKKELANLRSINAFNININNISDVKNVNMSEMRGDDIKLFDVAGDSLIFDDFRDLKKGNTNLEKEFIELRNEKNELVKCYKAQIDEIHKLTDEKERLINAMDTLKLEIERGNSDKERLGIEKEKVEIQLQKIDLENQRLKIQIERIENEKKRTDEDNKDLIEKIEAWIAEKSLKTKEIEKMKAEMSANKALLEKMLQEKQSLMNDYHSLHTEFEKYKQSHKVEDTLQKKISGPKTAKPGNVNASSTVQVSDTEILAMKNEIQNLKINNIQKDDIIRNLKEKIQTLESMEASSEDIVKKSEDLDFYKKSFEEQKVRVNREHELISASLYELALQFMCLKNELQKKMTGK